MEQPRQVPPNLFATAPNLHQHPYDALWGRQNLHVVYGKYHRSDISCIADLDGWKSCWKKIVSGPRTLNTMTEALWLSIISGLLSLIGTLGIIGLKDIGRRIKHLERQDAKLNAAILTLLIAKADDPNAIANALHSLMAPTADIDG